MHRLLLLAAVLLLVPVPAGAGPLIPAAAAAIVGSTTGIAFTVVSTVLGIASSLAINFGLGALFGEKPKARQPDLSRDLAQPRSLPPVRYVYGRARAFGSPAPVVVEEGDEDALWGCLLFNSRPSTGAFEVYVDKRLITYTGDPFDFSASGGGIATGPGKLARDSRIRFKFWIGLGDQTSPPFDVTNEYGSFFSSSDAWTGSTVLWYRADAGPLEDRTERWPTWPQAPLIEMVGRWSKVWNPNALNQDPDDPDTWTFSSNRALCTLDALMQNPVRPYRLDQIHIDSFKAAALTDGELVSRKDGTKELRHRVGGFIAWSDQELSEQIQPLVIAGGSPLTRIGGKLGIIEGVTPVAAMTIDDILEGDLTFETLKPGRDLASAVACSYVNDERDWQMADLPVYEVPGAVGNDGGLPTTDSLELGMVPSFTQAARLQKRFAYALREQKRLTCVLPPEAFDLVAGSAVQMQLPAPWSAMDGLYQVEQITPALAEDDDGGVAMRCNAVLREVLLDGYDWDPATEEPDIGTGETVNPVPVTLPAPSITLTSDGTTALNDGSKVYPRIKVAAADPGGARATSLEVRFRQSGDPDWESGGAVTRSEDGSATLYISPVEVGVGYEVQGRWVGGYGAGPWSGTQSITPAEPGDIPDAPTNGSATGGAAQISVTFDIGNDADFDAIEFYAGASSDTGAMTLFSGPIYGPANTTYGAIETGLGSAETRYYAARAVNPFGTRSPFSSVVNATTDP